MSNVSFRGVSKRYGKVVALDVLDLEIPDGAFVSLLGPSGSGKSTTLNLLAGLMDADGGDILIGGRSVAALPPERRDIAMVFQNYALYPHMTVAENIAFPLQARRPRPDAASIATNVERVAGLLGIAALLARYPKEISGGQQQRVALGRAMVRDPKVFLLDEPLSNLDARLRIRMRRDLKALHAQLRSTIIYVTHDQSEAMALSDLVAVFDGGRLQQFGTPAEIYRKPANLFVAGFVGDREANFLDGTIRRESGGATLRGAFGQVALGQAASGLADGRAVRLAARPEATRLLEPSGSAMTGTVLLTELAGADLYVTVLAEGGAEIVARTDPRDGTPASGERFAIAFDPAFASLFDQETGLAVTA